MSHLEERTEKICLNCNAGLVGRYCHKCGQENREPKESVWHFVTHFVNDFTHFDGKFFTTLKDLLFRPGFLSREYMLGKRERYLNPIRMYLFTSFIFFLIFLSVIHLPEPSLKVDDTELEVIKKMPDKEFNEMTAKLNNGKPMSRNRFNAFVDSVHASDTLSFAQSPVNAGADSIPTGKSWIDNYINTKLQQLNTKYSGNKSGTIKDFIEGFTHRFPQMLFISLPFVAFLLKLLYIRQKEYYYVSHGVFVIHLFIFLFFCLLALIGLDALIQATHWQWISWIINGITVLIFFYLYKAMRNFYQQGRAKTIIKYFLFLTLNIFLFALISLLFVLWSLAML